MKGQIRRLTILVSLVVCVVFLLFLVNQTNQVVELASKVDPGFGKFVLYGLLFLYAVLVGVPIYLFVNMPKPLRPPQSDATPEYDRFLCLVRKRLSANPYLSALKPDVSTREAIEEAIRLLDAHAEEMVRKTASTVFVTTAISQSGRLDAFVVLAVQTRMIWEVAHVYNQRPSLRELIQLYANVGATAFLAMELDDIDVSEQVEPVISNLLGGSLAGAIPGASVVATFVTNSILDGSANAFLTLRVGLIARSYCNVLVTADRRAIRRSASLQAARMLSGIVVSCAGRISKAAWGATRRKASRLNPFKRMGNEPEQPETI